MTIGGDGVIQCSCFPLVLSDLPFLRVDKASSMDDHMTQHVNIGMDRNNLRFKVLLQHFSLTYC